MKDIDDIFASAVQVTRANKADKVSSLQQQLLPMEEIARGKIDTLSTQLDLGSSALDKQYKRIDLKAIAVLAKRQRGVPFPVPRFAIFDVSAKACRLTVKGDDPNAIEMSDTAWSRDRGNMYAATLEIMKTTLRHAMIRNEILARIGLILAGIAGGVLTTYIFGWSADVGGQSRSVLHIFGAIALVAVGLATTMASAVSIIAPLLTLKFMSKSSEMFYGNYVSSVSMAFGGSVPDPVRRMINSHISGRTFENIYVVTEAPKWGYTTSKELFPMAYEGDPLVIGEWNGAYYLLERFDMVPLEKWAASEFIL